MRPGGWAFQYNNAHYPDLDDTAVVVMAMDRAAAGDRRPTTTRRSSAAREWTVGLQSRDGGWGAFDADNSYHYLNNIPFADHGALLDPPTADVSARCVSMLAQLGEPRDSRRMRRRSTISKREQDARRQLVRAAGASTTSTAPGRCCARSTPPGSIREDADGRARAVGWLIAIQNPDGGWGEDCDSYDARSYTGYTPCALDRLADRLGAARADGGGRGRSPGGRARRRLAGAHQDADGLWGQEHVHRRRFPARLLPALPRLSEIFPALGAGALPQPQALQHARAWRTACDDPRRVRAEARGTDPRAPGCVVVAGGGDRGAAGGRAGGGVRGGRHGDPVERVWPGRWIPR